MSATAKMTTDLETIGGNQDVLQDVSPAQQLQEKHTRDPIHQPTVEDEIDEANITRPLPSAPPKPPAVGEDTSQPMSEKAAGKQKATEEPTELTPPKVNAEPAIVLDTKSEDAFPALGGGPKPQNQARVPMAWGARKPLGVANAVPNGINGQGPLSSTASSRESTPASGKLTPASTNPSVTSQPRGLSAPQYIPIPGRHSERIQFAPSQLLPRKELKKPLPDVLRSINKSSKANVEMKLGPSGTIIFEGTGPVDATRQALRDVAKEVGSKVYSILIRFLICLMVLSNRSKSLFHSVFDLTSLVVKALLFKVSRKEQVLKYRSLDPQKPQRQNPTRTTT